MPDAIRFGTIDTDMLKKRTHQPMPCFKEVELEFHELGTLAERLCASNMEYFPKNKTC